MKKVSALIILLVLIVSCTKEVPETEKRLSKSVNENEIRDLVNQFVSYFNSGKLDQAMACFASDFNGYVPDSDSGLDALSYENNLTAFLKQHPEGKIQMTTESVFVSEDFGAVQVFTSYLTFDPIENKMNPIYSERTFYLLRKDKIESWKIFRSLSASAFSYD